MLEVLGQGAATGRVPRVLISGAADCGILAHVVAAYGSAAAPVDVTLVDRCRTPLLANEWFASSSGVPLATHQSDILTFQPAAAFDVICAHSFLGGFDADGRRAVARRWHEWLRPGGVVVAVSPVFVGRAEAYVGPDASQVERIRAAVARVDDHDCQRLGVTRSAVVAWAEEYIQRKARHLLRSTEELFGPFQDAGFRVVQGGLEAPADGAMAVRARVVFEREPRPQDHSSGAPV